MRIESVERPSVVIVYWILGAILTVTGVLLLRDGANILVAWVPLVIGGLLLYGAWVTTRDRVRQGAIVLELQTPVAPGGPLHAKLVAGSHLGDARDLDAELRCLEVKYVWRSDAIRNDRGATPEQKVLWRSQARFALQRSASRSESEISFDLPVDAQPTVGNASIFLLEDGFYWEIVIGIPIGKQTSLRTYRIPVQRAA
jgi:hypothetical protein